VDATIAGKRLRRGARLWTVATSTFKAETYRFLRLDPPDEAGPSPQWGGVSPTEPSPADGERFPPGFLHLPGWVDAEWLKQLTAEQLVTVKNKRGFAKLEWQKLRERNEALDCRVYARAAAWILGADRWSNARWDELATQFAFVDAGGAATGAALQPPRKAQVRRVARSSYMG
jgi:phage terminase large subunit GpA-like protein